MAKYGHLSLPGVFWDKVNSVINSIDEAVTQCNISVINDFVEDGNI